MRVLRSIAHGASDVLLRIGRIPGAIGRGARGAWAGLSLPARRRLALALAGGVVAALIVAFTIPRLPCAFPGGEICAPEDDAELVVPADALGYVHVTLDPESDQYQEAADAVEGLPELTRQLTTRLIAQVPGPGGTPADFGRDISPWLGTEAAVAIIPQGGGAEQVQLLDEGDDDGAAEYARRIAAGAPRTETYEDVDISVDQRGLATASIGGFLAIGTESGVRRLAEVESGAEGARALADEPASEELREELPPTRFAEAYVSEDGIEQLIASEQSPLASLDPFVDASASTGAAASIGAEGGTLELTIRSSLDPERAESSPGFFAAFPAYEPSLPERLSKGTLGYVGLADPGTTARELLSQATAQAPALAEALSGAVSRLRDLGRVDVEEQLLPALDGEAAFALQPGPEEGGSDAEQETTAPPAVPEGLPAGPAPTVPSEPPVPVLQFLADGVDTEDARDSLAGLQGPIAEALQSESSLQAPVFESREVDGVDLQALRVSPTVNLTYGLAGESLAVATQPSGVEQLITGDGGLDETEDYEEATDGFGEELSLQAFLDLSGLIGLGEREGLAEDPAYAAFAPEIRRLEALGLAIDAEETSIDSDARLVIGNGEPSDSGEAESPSG